MRRGVGAALVILILLAGSDLVRATAGPLRQADWAAVLAADPDLQTEHAEPRPRFSPAGPFVVVRARERVIAPDPDVPADFEVEGYANLTTVAYGDLDGDGAEEALIALESGGTAGTVGLLLYREGAARPQLVLAMPGYHQWARIEGGRLLVSLPHYVGFEGNCCPSSSVTTTYALEGARLITLAQTEEPFPHACAYTVYAFYRALDAREFADAYAFLSPAFQSANPYPEWVAGFAATTSIEAEAEDGPGENEVRVALVATDRTATGGTLARRFTGAWTVVWSASARRWLLDRAVIRAA